MTRRGVIARLLTALCGAAIAAGGARAQDERVVWPAALHAKPEADPADKYTARDPWTSNGLDKVVVKVSAGPFRAERLEVLVPDLTVSSALAMRQAFPEVVWKPVLRANGEPVDKAFTLLRQVGR
jgi:hypothetical protein